jgi:hypothetical protein
MSEEKTGPRSPIFVMMLLLIIIAGYCTKGWPQDQIYAVITIIVIAATSIAVVSAIIAALKEQ